MGGQHSCRSSRPESTRSSPGSLLLPVRGICLRRLGLSSRLAHRFLHTSKQGVETKAARWLAAVYWALLLGLQQLLLLSAR